MNNDIGLFSLENISIVCILLVLAIILYLKGKSSEKKEWKRERARLMEVYIKEWEDKNNTPWIHKRS